MVNTIFRSTMTLFLSQVATFFYYDVGTLLNFTRHFLLVCFLSYNSVILLCYSETITFFFKQFSHLLCYSTLCLVWFLNSSNFWWRKWFLFKFAWELIYLVNELNNYLNGFKLFWFFYSAFVFVSFFVLTPKVKKI